MQMLQIRTDQKRGGKIMEPIIEVKGLKKYFQTPRGLLHAVDDVTFSIERGKTLGVVGEASGQRDHRIYRTIWMWKIYTGTYDHPSA